MSDGDTHQLGLTLPGHDGSKFYVEAVSGTERLNEAYQFTVHVIATETLDFASMVGKAASITLGVADEEMTVHGVITVARMLDPTPNRDLAYAFVIEPALSLMRYSAQNQIYGTDQDVTPIDVIEAELSDGNKSSSNTGSDRPARSISYEMKATAGDYQTFDFLLQYGESDFNFLNRICERFGVFYCFDHSGDAEKVQFGDKNAHFQYVEGRSISKKITYRLPNISSAQGQLCIHSFTAECSAQSHSLKLTAYNDEKPSVDLTVATSTSFEGQGLVVHYNENYAVKDDGEALAKIRKEQLETERMTFQGTSDVPLMRPGLIFELEEHPDSDYDKRYIVTEVHHDVVQQTPVGGSTIDFEARPYENRFTCIPFDLPDNASFRPAPKTAKPVMSGFLLGTVDAEGDGKRAELDDFGRYKVTIMNEESGLGGGKASFFLRKLEPYGGGSDEGSHFTLNKGTEVLIGSLGGDPDRLLIVGALSNGDATATVTSENNTTAFRIRSASGAVFELNDGAV
ncbi:MAG: type VI secretion system tip protein TssI/VgrG [Pseudomonadota bacterium]